MSGSSVNNPRVALFATCLVDLFRPSVGFATVRLLEQAGCDVEVPTSQTCCGQPAYNNGDRDNAIAIARQVIDTFSKYDYVVIPSGSCGGMIKTHYPSLFESDDTYHARATALASRTHELTEFLTEVLGIDALDAEYSGKVTYHDSCSCLRELQIREQPRALLAKVRQLELMESGDSENCCGFGGTFSVKYPQISTRMADDKINAVEQSGADTLVAADLGCLFNLAGRLKRNGSAIRVFHIAEILANMADDDGIGGAGK